MMPRPSSGSLSLTHRWPRFQVVVAGIREKGRAPYACARTPQARGAGNAVSPKVSRLRNFPRLEPVELCRAGFSDPPPVTIGRRRFNLMRMKFVPRKTIVPLLAAGAVLGTAVWFWATTFISVGYWQFPDRCPVHFVKTASEFEPNRGFVTVSHRGHWIAAKKAWFPLDTFNDGYGHPNRRYRRILQAYCPECRRAREAWTASSRPNCGGLLDDSRTLPAAPRPVGQ